MWKPAATLLISCCLLFGGCAERPPLNNASVPGINADDILYHIKYLASDTLEGRLSGTRGCDAAEEYIAAEFKRLGLKPLGQSGTYFQEFDFVGGVELGDHNEITFRRGDSDTTLSLGEHFMPAGFSSSAIIDTGVVFAGYSIAAKNLNYDDYAGLEVNGKAVLALRYSPATSDPHSGFSEFEALRYKALQAREHGAAALLVITSSAEGESEPLPKLRFDRAAGDAGLPVVFINKEAAEWLLAGHSNLDSLKARIDRHKQPHSFVIEPARIHLQTSVNKIRREAQNVIGLVPGADPVLRMKAVVIGAHHDHLGRSSEGALDPEIEGGIRNGADDNASGTAGVLELAQYFVTDTIAPRQSLIFMTFSGEELGLLGSSHFVGNPTHALENTTAMINMDMVGRMKDSTLIVQGVGTSPRWTALVQHANAEGRLRLNLKQDGLGPSDHASFYQKNIPVLFLFTGLHENYHRVSDDSDKINAVGEEEVLKFVARIVSEVANSDSVLLFTKAESDERRQARGFRVSLGIIPDYATEVEGLKLGGVRPGSSAERAGLMTGDVIIKFGELEIRNIYDYTYALGEYSPGDEVEVVWLRNGQSQRVTIKLEASRGR